MSAGLETPELERSSRPPSFELPPPPLDRGDGDAGGGGDRSGDGADPGRPLRVAMLAMWFVLAGEAMFFVTLVSLHLMSRGGEEVWTAEGMPTLPIGRAATFSIFLLASAPTLWSARRALLEERTAAARRITFLTAALGVVFLGTQGLEWLRLVSYGITAWSGLYGALFYLVIGAHALHAIAGVGLLLLAASRLPPSGPVPMGTRILHTLASMFWAFVILVWPVLYLVVYL